MSNDQTKNESLRREIERVLNQHSAENGSNTPDFILARYLLDCLRAFDLATDQREHWYGLRMRPGGVRAVEQREE